MIIVAMGMPEDLIFRRQYMGEPFVLRLGGQEIRIRERYGPDKQYTMRDGEFLYVTGEDRPDPFVMVNERTYRYLAKHIWRLDIPQAARQWEDMSPREFYDRMYLYERYMKEHFAESKALGLILSRMERKLINLQGHLEPCLRKAEEIVRYSNHELQHLMEPRLVPVQFEVRYGVNPGSLLLQQRPQGSLRYKRFTEEFDHVLRAFEYGWVMRQQGDESKSYEVQGDDEPFPPDP